VRKLMLHILPLSARQPGLLNEAVIAASLPRYDLERISAPTLVVSLADDLYETFESARYTAAHIRGAQLHVYPSGGHVWVGHHDEILMSVLAFLDSAAAPLGWGFP